MKICMLGPVMTEGLLEWITPGQREEAMQTPGMGGSAVTNLVRARLQRKLDTELITFCPKASSVRLFDGEYFKLWICPRRYQMGARSAYKQARHLIGDILKESDAELCHAHWTYDYAMGFIASRRKGVITVRDHARNILRWNGMPFLPAYFWTQYIFKKHQMFSAVSPYVAEYVERCTGQAVPVIPNNVDSDWLPSASPVFKNEDVTIASASSWASFKNIKNTLRAFDLIRAQKAGSTLILMGPGLEQNGPAHSWAAKRSLDHNVSFLGRCQYTRVLNEFAKADVILHSSLEESFGNPLLEGMALQKLVVAGSQAGGCPWVLDHGQAGLLVDVCNPAEIASAIMQCMEDGRSIDQKLNRSRELLDSRYHADTVLQQYQDLYEQTLSV